MHISLVVPGCFIATPSLCWASGPGWHAALRCHISFVSFHLEWFLRISLSFTKLIFFKRTSQLFSWISFNLGVPGSFCVIRLRLHIFGRITTLVMLFLSRWMPPAGCDASFTCNWCSKRQSLLRVESISGSFLRVECLSSQWDTKSSFLWDWWVMWSRPRGFLDRLSYRTVW